MPPYMTLAPWHPPGLTTIAPWGSNFCLCQRNRRPHHRHLWKFKMHFVVLVNYILVHVCQYQSGGTDRCQCSSRSQLTWKSPKVKVNWTAHQVVHGQWYPCVVTCTFNPNIWRDICRYSGKNVSWLLPTTPILPPSIHFSAFLVTLIWHPFWKWISIAS